MRDGAFIVTGEGCRDLAELLVRGGVPWQNLPAASALLGRLVAVHV